MSLFCKTADCQQPICQLCLIKEHMGHEVVDIAEEQKEKRETIKNIADELTSQLTLIQRNLLKTKECLKKRNENTLAVLKERKTKAIKLFNQMIKVVTNQIDTSNNEVDQEVSIINRELELVNSVRERAVESCTNKGEIPDGLAIIQEIRERVERNFLSSEKSFRYCKVNDSKKAREEGGTNITQKTMQVQLFDANKGKNEADIVDCPPRKKSRPQESTPEKTWEGAFFRKIDSKMFLCFYIPLKCHVTLFAVSGTTFVGNQIWKIQCWLENENCIMGLGGKRQEGMELIKIYLESNMEPRTTIVEKIPCGMAHVILAGRSRLALALE